MQLKQYFKSCLNYFQTEQFLVYYELNLFVQLCECDHCLYGKKTTYTLKKYEYVILKFFCILQLDCPLSTTTQFVNNLENWVKRHTESLQNRRMFSKCSKSI